MSITVTIEELRNYESAMEAWYMKRLEAASLITIEDSSRFGDDRQRGLKWKQSMQDWIKENPMPKLIPSI